MGHERSGSALLNALQLHSAIVQLARLGQNGGCLVSMSASVTMST